MSIYRAQGHRQDSPPKNQPFLEERSGQEVPVVQADFENLLLVDIGYRNEVAEGLDQQLVEARLLRDGVGGI